jgi:hypothetical protein
MDANSGNFFYTIMKGCGSGSGFNDFVDLDSESGSGSMGKKNEEKRHFSLTF